MEHPVPELEPQPDDVVVALVFAFGLAFGLTVWTGSNGEWAASAAFFASSTAIVVPLALRFLDSRTRDYYREERLKASAKAALSAGMDSLNGVHDAVPLLAFAQLDLEGLSRRKVSAWSACQLAVSMAASNPDRKQLQFANAVLLFQLAAHGMEFSDETMATARQWIASSAKQ